MLLALFITSSIWTGLSMPPSGEISNLGTRGYDSGPMDVPTIIVVMPLTSACDCGILHVAVDRIHPREESPNADGD
jgi:hypothetical protein